MNEYSSTRFDKSRKQVFVDCTPEMLLMQWGKKGGGRRGTRNTADQKSRCFDLRNLVFVTFTRNCTI